MSRADMYFSCDIESDGPIPGEFSMLSYGLCVAGTYDGRQFRRAGNLESATFYRELKPISENFQPDALAVCGLDRDELLRDGIDPERAMTSAAIWVKKTAENFRPVFVAYPLSFDWSYSHWYFEKFSKIGDPFGFSSALDMKTMYAVKAGACVSDSTKRSMPKRLLSKRRHTHNALDDAIEQAELFCNLMRWDGQP